MIDSIISIQFWVVAAMLFVGGIFVGKFLFEVRQKTFTRPAAPPDPGGYQPVPQITPRNPRPPPKTL